MNDIAELTLRINSLEANQAAAALDKLQASGKGAAQTASLLEGAFNKLMAVLGPTALAYGLYRAVSGALELQASFVKLAEVAGTTSSMISAMDLPARLAGVSLDTVAASVARLGRALGEAQLGDVAKRGMLKALGIDPKDGRDAALVMVDVAKALVGMKDQNVAGAASLSLLGRGYAELRPFMKELVEQGGLIARTTDEQNRAAKAFEDELVKLNFQIGQSKIALANDLLPWLNSTVVAMNAAYKSGGLLAAAIAGIQTAITGTDLDQANREIFETGEAIARLGKRINELGEGGKDRSPWYDRSLLNALNAQMDEAQARLARAQEYKRQLENPGAVGSQVIAPAAAAAPEVGGSAEDKVRKLMEAAKHYEEQINQLKAYGARYAEEIRTANTLADLAEKEGGVQNQRTAEELLLEKLGNNQANLMVQREYLKQQKELSEGQGNLAKAAEAAGAIAVINSQIVANEVITQAQIQAARTETFQKQRDEYNAWAAAAAAAGETVAESLMGERELEERHYADRLNSLEVFIAAQGEAYTGGAALRERFEADHQAKMGSLEAQGAQQRLKLEQMTLREQASFYFGTLAQITAAGAQHNKTLFELNKVASIANAIISTYEGASKALAWGWPLGPVFAGIIAAAGAANIAVIAGTHFGSGTSAPSIGGGAAIQTTPAPGSPATPVSGQTGGQPVLQVIIQGNVLGTRDFVDNTLIPALRDAIDQRDFIIIGQNSRQADNLTG